MKIDAYAKINLSLDLTGVLPDGYHAINTVMQSVSLCDTLEVTEKERGIELICSDKNVPTDNRNTAYKAAELFFQRTGINKGLKITIEKNIPSQAGLGGGSADGAGVLYALFRMYPNSISLEGLFELALQVGADVPFCLSGGTRLCEGKGEIMTPLPDYSSWVLLAKPQTGVSTKEAFARFDRATKLTHPDSRKIFQLFSGGLGDEALEYSLNIFEQLADLPQGEAIKQAFRHSGAFYSSMSGSGSCFFGLYKSREMCIEAEKSLKEIVPFVKVCHTVNAGISAEK